MTELLPTNPESERGMIGAILQHGDQLAEIRSALQAEDFSLESNRRIVRTAYSLHDSREPVNASTVGRQLQNEGKLDLIGGLAYIAQCSSEWLPNVYSLDRQVQEVKDLSIRRRVIAEAHRIADRAGTLTEDLPTVLAEFADIPKAIASEQVSKSSIGGSEIIERAGGFEAFMKPKPGLDTGFRSLNFMTGGLASGDLIILAARPSIGKTAFALNLTHHAAKKTGVHIFSLEMEPAALMRRLIAMRAAVSYQQLRLGNLTPEQRREVARAAAEIAGLPIHYESKLGSSVIGIRSELQKIQRKHEIGLVIVDYLQLMHGSGGRGQDRNNEIAGITRALKIIAGECAVPLVVLSQLTRGPARENRPPTLSDLRDSGAIESDADLVMLLHKEESDLGSIDRISLHLAKQRNGEIGKINFALKREHGRFSEEASE